MILHGPRLKNQFFPLELSILLSFKSILSNEFFMALTKVCLNAYFKMTTTVGPKWKEPSQKNIVLAKSSKSGEDRLKCLDLGFYGLKCFLPITIIVFKPVFKSTEGWKVKKLHHIHLLDLAKTMFFWEGSFKKADFM